MKLPFIWIFKRRWVQVLLVLVCAFGGYFYWQSSKKQDNLQKTYTVNRQDITQAITATGKLTAKNSATLKFQTSGKLAWVNVKKGDKVTAWQGIAGLDQAELEKKLKKDLLDYMNTRMDFDEVTLTTYQDKVLTDTIQRIKNKNQNNLDLAVLDVEIASIAKEHAILVSPIAGIVTIASDEHPGVNVSSTTQYVIVDPTTIYFEAEIEELDIGKIQEGMPATIHLDAFESETYSSRVESIDFTATQTSSGTTAYLVHFPIQLDPNFRLGMNGDINILTQEKKQVLAIPIEAVEETETEKQVRVKKGETEELKSIKTGLETDEYYEVIEGLIEGDTIILP